MREALGGISLFQIVVVFILLFTAVMCLTINHSKAFAVKDEIINIMEKQNLGSSNSNDRIEEAAEEISQYLNDAGYRITGKCPDSSWTGYDRNGNEARENAAFCIKKNSVSEAFYNDLRDKCANNKCTPIKGDYPEMDYYDILLFYQLDLPIIGDAINFTIKGSTRTLSK